jgi:hypothetical protein
LNKSPKLTRIPLTERVARSKQRKASGIRWPSLVDHRLDELVGLAKEAGERTNRAELAAAIVCGSPADPPRLRKMLTSYRQADGRAVLVDAPGNSSSFEPRRHPPGPRSE